MIVQPSSFRTDFHGRSMHTTPTTVAAYAGTQAGDINAMLVDYGGKEAGDPIKGVRAIIDALDAPEPPLRLILGADAVNAIEARQDQARTETAKWRGVAIATAFSG